MQDNKEVKRNNSPKKGPMGRGVPEKPKDFGTAIKRLTGSLKDFKVLILLSIILAGLSAVLALSSPNRLSKLTDEISKGLVINTKNANLLSEEILSNISEDKLPKLITNILNINIDENTIYQVNTSSISNEDKQVFNSTLAKINNDKANTIKYIGELPSTILNLLLDDSTYNDISVTKEDKIRLLSILSNINIEEKNFSFIKELPDSIKEIILPPSTVDKVEISTKDKVEFISIMSSIKEDAETNEIYKIMGQLPDSIQKVINPKMNMEKVKRIVIILAGIYILSSVFNFIQGRIMVIVSNKYAKNLRTKISKKINKLPLKYFDNTLSGDILSRITNDVDTIAQSLNQSLATLVSSLTLFIGSIIMMFTTNWILALTAIISSLFGFIFMFIILGKSQKYFTRRQTELGNLNGYIEEVYSGLNVLKTCNGKEESNKKFDDLNEKLYDCNRKSQFLSGLMHPMMGFIGNFGYVCVCIVGALLASKEIITFV